MNIVVSSQQLVVGEKQKIKSFEDLNVWKISHELVLEIYKSTHLFPKEELYSLTSQIRRATISVPANIAEGFLRRSPRDKIHFYNMAQSSLSEVKYYLILTRDLGYISSRFKISQLSAKATEVAKMLNSLISSIEDRI